MEEVRIAKRFAKKHWRAIVQSYARAKFFKKYERYFEILIYPSRRHRIALRSQSALPKGDFRSSRPKYEIRLVERILVSKATSLSGSLSICQSLDANRYLSGPAAKSYLKTEIFEEAGILVEWMDYSGYQPYNQVWPGFEPAVSIVDLIFNIGPSAIDFMKSAVKNPLHS